MDRRIRKELTALHAHIAPRFARPEVRARAGRYLAGLLEEVGRRNGWQIAEKIGENRPDGVQRLLNKARWNAELLRNDLRNYVVRRIGDPTGVLVIVETGFHKKGAKSVGVARQYNPSSGQVENCQVGVFLAYASLRGWAFIDRALYLPEEWAEDEKRRREAGVPEGLVFATKGELARTMLERAFVAGLRPAWVAGSGFCGEYKELRQWLETKGRSYVLAVSPSHGLWKRIDGAPSWEQAEEPPYIRDSWPWKRMKEGANSWWARDCEWVRHSLAYRAFQGWERWLLTGRSVVQPDKSIYYRTYSPEGASLAKLVRIANLSLTVEEGVERAKGEVGLDQYEVRRWEAWHRHVTLCLLAHAALQTAKEDAEGDETGQRVL